MKYKVKIKIFIFGWRQGRDGGGSVTYVVITWNNYSIYILLCNLVINIKKDIPHTCTPCLFDNRTLISTVQSIFSASILRNYN